MATKVKWGELEPKVPDKPKTFEWDDEKIPPEKKSDKPKKPKKEMFFRKGGMVKGQNRDYCK